MLVITMGFAAMSFPLAASADPAPQKYWNSITSSSDGSKLAAVVENGSIYTSTDSGATWIEQTSAGSRYWSSITSSSDGTKLAAAVSGGYIWTSNNSGVTWIAQTGAGSGYWKSITSSSDGTKLAVVLNPGKIYTSTDSGASWTLRESPRFWTSITSSSDGTKLAAAVDNGAIYTSIDSGATWTARRTAGSRTWVYLTSSSDGSKLVAAKNNGYIYTSTDSGANWASVSVAVSQSWASITSSSDGSKLAAALYGGSIYLSTDSGATWAMAPAQSQPSAPTITSAIAGDHQITVAFTAGADGGAAISDYKYSINGGAYISVGGTTSPFTITGLSSNTSYSVTILALNSQGAGTPSNTLQVTTSLSAADIKAAADAAAKAAAEKREAEKQDARRQIILKAIAQENIPLELFNKASIAGVSDSNVSAINSEVVTLSQDARSDINQILKIVRKFEVVGAIGSDQVERILPRDYVEVGLIPENSKNKTALASAIKKLPVNARDSFEEIKAVIDLEIGKFQARQDRLAAVISRYKTRTSK